MKPVKYRLATLKEVSASIDNTRLLFFDTETFNKSKHYNKSFYGQVRLAQFMQEHWEEALIVDMYVGASEDKEHWEALDEIVFSNIIVGHTVSYDFQTLQEQRGNIYRPVRHTAFHDTLHLFKEIFPISTSFALPMLYKACLGYDPYDTLNIDKKKLQKQYWGGLLDSTSYAYAAADVYYYPEAFAFLMSALDSMPNKEDVLHRVDNAKIAVDAGLKMQSMGFVLEPNTTEAYYAKNKQAYAQAMAKLGQLGVPSSVNIRSSTQVREALSIPSSSKTDLAFGAYRDSDERCSALIDAREALYRYETVEKWHTLQTDLGYISGKFSPTTVTGRYQSSQENMQNAPRDTKPLIMPRKYGNIQPILIGFDFSQIELRTMCALTGERYSYDIYAKDGDIHNDTKERFNLDERVIAKNVNFGYSAEVKAIE